MRFDFVKELIGDHRYDRMSPERISFHNALGRSLALESRKLLSWTPSITDRRDRRDTIKLFINIDADGHISHRLIRRGKKETAIVRIENIDHLIEDTIYFLSVCADYGYLLADEPEVKEGAL